MKIFFRLGLLIVALALAVWLWMWLFPPPEKVIRRQIQKLAQAASFEADSGNIAKLAYASKLVDFFSKDAKVHLNASEVGQHTITGREELQQAALAARANLNSLAVKLLDVNVTLDPDKQSARVELTARATARGEENFFVQELRLSFKKIEGDWLITRVESVKVLQ